MARSNSLIRDSSSAGVHTAGRRDGAALRRCRTSGDARAYIQQEAIIWDSRRVQGYLDEAGAEVFSASRTSRILRASAFKEKGFCRKRVVTSISPWRAGSWFRHNRTNITFMSGRSDASSPASFAPTHLGHDHVRDHQIDGTVVRPGELQRFGPIRCFQNDIAVQAEKLARGLPDRRFIFGQQQSFAASRAACRGKGRRLQHKFRLPRPGRINLEGRAQPGLAVHQMSPLSGSQCRTPWPGRAPCPCLPLWWYRKARRYAARARARFPFPSR
jgi:hypothetical protein